MSRRVHVIVHGRVQGVGFRYAAQAEAERLGITGWVRNRRDGTVEADLNGSDSAIADMLAWLASGPPGARVTKVESTDAPAAEDAASGFEMRPTE
jgi:acylphosphatase